MDGGPVLTGMPVAALLILCLVLALRRPSSLVPSITCGSLFLVMGLWGAPLWNWSRVNNGAGLTDTFTADPSIAAAGNQAFLWAAAGCFTGGLGAAAFMEERVPPLKGRIDKWIDRLVLVIAVTMIVLWLLGQGNSVLQRDVYLETDGNDQLLTATSLVGPLVGVAALASSGTRSKPLVQRVAAWASAIIWFVLLTAMGSRIAVVFPLVTLYLIAEWALNRRGLRSVVALVVGGHLCLYAAVTAFTVSQFVRSTSHGLNLWVANWTAPGTPQFADITTWASPLQRVVSSIAASAVITDMSASYPPPLRVLIANANPLPSSMVGNAVNPYSYERLWPLDWVPLSFIGEWFGATGAAGQFLLFAAISLFAGVLLSLYRRIGFSFGYVVAIALPLMACLIAIQYPSRMFWRMISVLVAMAFGLAAPRLLDALFSALRKDPSREST